MFVHLKKILPGSVTQSVMCDSEQATEIERLGYSRFNPYEKEKKDESIPS